MKKRKKRRRSQLLTQLQTDEVSSQMPNVAGLIVEEMQETRFNAVGKTVQT